MTYILLFRRKLKGFLGCLGRQNKFTRSDVHAASAHKPSHIRPREVSRTIRISCIEQNTSYFNEWKNKKTTHNVKHRQIDVNADALEQTLDVIVDITATNSYDRAMYLLVLKVQRKRRRLVEFFIFLCSF